MTPAEATELATILEARLAHHLDGRRIAVRLMDDEGGCICDGMRVDVGADLIVRPCRLCRPDEARAYARQEMLMALEEERP